MKRFLKAAGVILLAVMTTNCSRDNDEISNLQNSTPPSTKPEPKKILKKLTLEKTEIELTEGETAKIKITSGNGAYSTGQKYLPELWMYCKFRISKDNQYVEVEGIQAGTLTTVSIYDDLSMESVEVAAHVLAPHAKRLELLNLNLDSKDPKTKEIYLEKTKAFIEEYERLKKELEKYPELSGRYYKQRKLWEESLTFVPQNIENFKKYTKDTELSQIKNHYKDIYVYGVGYAYVELLSRKAVEYQKTHFPNDNTLLNLIEKIASGDYSTQEGNDFIHGFNGETRKYFNEFVDKFNELKRKQ